MRGQLYDVRVSADSVNDWGGELGALVNYYSTQWWHGGSGHDNNGNVLMSQTIIGSYYMEDRYSYDSLNRLTSVAEFQNGSVNTGAQSYLYDRYGNRTININSSATWGTGINNKEFTVNTANNRLSVPGGQSGTMTYDNAGNLTTDTYSGAGVMRVYDAENRMTTETQPNSYLAGSYTYNANGRVKRKVNGTETWQVYGIDGELLAEYAAKRCARESAERVRLSQWAIVDYGGDIEWFICAFGAGHLPLGRGWNTHAELVTERLVSTDGGCRLGRLAGAVLCGVSV